MAVTTNATAEKPERIYPPRKFSEHSGMPEDYRKAVLRLLLETGELASTKFHQELMRQVVAWVELAPTVEDKVRMAELYADEMRHGYIFENLVLSFGETVDVEGSMSSIEGLHLVAGITTWEQVAVFNTLFDRAGAFQLDDYQESSYAPLANIAKSITLDEFGHAATGLIHLTAICRTPEGRATAQKELDWMWPHALDMFGTSTGRRQFVNIEWGLRTLTNDEQRRKYIAHTRPLLEKIGLTAPDDRANRNFL